MKPRVSLPVMQCDQGCGECCGPVLCHEHEYKAVNAFAVARKLSPLSQGLTCPWFQDGKCQVYEVRPFACRLFGHVPGMTCCRGYNANISASAERRAVRDYGKPTRLLHEVFGSDFLERLQKQ